jgi:hypothetical protein
VEEDLVTKRSRLAVRISAAVFAAAAAVASSPVSAFAEYDWPG